MEIATVRATIHLGKEGLSANTDGCIVIVGLGSNRGSTRLGNIPVVSYEVCILIALCATMESSHILPWAKRRHVGGKHRATGAVENPAVPFKAQEVGNLLGQAMTSCRQIMSTGRTRRHGSSPFTAWK